MFDPLENYYGADMSLASWSGYGKALAKKYPTMQPDTGLILGFMAAGRYEPISNALRAGEKMLTLPSEESEPSLLGR